MDTPMIEKLRDCFDEMVVYKDLKKSSFFSALGLPSFLRDWLLKKFEDDDGKFDSTEVTDFVKQYLPKRSDWMRIKDLLVTENEHVKILTRVSADINIKNQEISFALPDFSLSNKETVIDPNVWTNCRDKLVNGRDVWGVVELGYRLPDEDAKEPGKIKLVDFTSFCPYTVELDYYKDARADFTLDEWIDVLLGAIDYNASGYKDRPSKLAMLTRLLPFLEKRLNLIELAPKGTGKSYVFGHVSRYGFLTDGGKITRAKMFYDSARKTPGFVIGNDYVAIDEVKLVTFNDVNEMRSIMQGYMEYGTFNFAGYEGKSDAGIIFLGNIAKDNMDVQKNMFGELPTLFQESALLDRIHGFIKGWDIPRMHEDLKICGWALNSEYFSSIMHLLRDDSSYRAIVDSLVIIPEHADTRDTEAVKRITTAYLKLLFPNVRSPEDLATREALHDFREYCLRPARDMRDVIKIQLGILDNEFSGKNVPQFKVKGLDEKG